MPLHTAALRQPAPLQPMPAPVPALRQARRPALPTRAPSVGPVVVISDDVFPVGAETVALEKDEALFYEGDDARTVYRVVEGMVRISIMLADGRRHIVDFLQPGDMVGLSAAAEYAHTAEAVTATKLVRMPRARLEAAMDQRPALARKLFTRMQADLVAAHERLLLLGRKSVPERLASLLLLLRDRQPAGGEAPQRVALPMGRTDIADYLGLTIETVSRTFTKLRSGGVIRLADTYTVEIDEPERLAEIAAGR
ncbi:cyclic nucleotide-binding domain-containing protein [Azospirillum sp. TSO22-1]|uniref:Crp/Fnr family transcriptional regulator n=1 Tax=Azospirillum sp. TSO22-1 TaxID=716789 RepID=UPI000D646EF8|nr:cyclic nucleotide-binding domain-containing protein [Azospirillum sp. TSO22-1]